MTDPLSRGRTAVVVALVLALAGSLWAALGGASCQACSATSRPLAWLGVAWYALLLSAGRAPRPRATGIAVAAGVHVALLALLAAQGRLCWPCLLTAAAALAAAALVLADRAGRRLNVTALVGAATVSGAAIVAAGWARPAEPPGPAETNPARIVARAAAKDVVRRYRHREGQPPQVVVFTMDGCWHCADFEAGPLAEAQRRLPGRFTVRHLLPPKDMHVPVVIVLGAEHYLFHDAPDLDSLTRAVERASGGAGLPPRSGLRL